VGYVLPTDILADVSYVLLEQFVDTQLGTAVSGPPGAATVFPLSMVGIYVGAILVVDEGTPNMEAVTVTAITATSFTAAFANAHISTAPLNGATFSSGLFTQAEMLEYLHHTENDFLVKVRPVYAAATQNLSGNRYYPQPADAIRIERISSSSVAWNDTSQLSLDMDNPNWQSDHQSADPKAWFQDEIGLDQFGIWPLIDIGGLVANIWYSQKQVSVTTFLSPFVVPDIFTMYLKYGVLARAFSKDGEQRDDLRAKFCQKRFDFGVMLARMFLLASETLAAELEADQSQMSKFSPMVLTK
jgi:hypothetical protein